MSKWIQPGHRIMDKAYLRHGRVTYTGEQLVLALLLHTKGRTKRGSGELEQVAKMLNDPNVNRKRKNPRRKPKAA
ncbi:hypothetical protein SEA_FORREST_166 [Streptomyces phage Forrest]|uniref:Uncharacterized protein n=1 Tax=Streptomyces phage MeganTheeKilla TaxID=2801897 RepID=A0A7U0GC61_9CAUD|nr:hypothetical protein SEA_MEGANTHEEKILLA_162 [Streptomyces phage MeganTheeKilla]QZE11278.1 hypothetical protein SEA_FORREST_166 [Streptomyces phage Forrest]QZE11504.1 hypothetical protein SEA_JADA_163 [Streptomyces phage Jada]